MYRPPCIVTITCHVISYPNHQLSLVLTFMNRLYISTSEICWVIGYSVVTSCHLETEVLSFHDAD